MKNTKIVALFLGILMNHVNFAAELSIYNGVCKGHKLMDAASGDFFGNEKMVQKGGGEPNRRIFDIEVMYGANKTKKIDSLKEAMVCHVLGQEKTKLGTSVSSGIHSFNSITWKEGNADGTNPGAVQVWQAQIPSTFIMLTGFVVLYEGGRYRINFNEKGAQKNSWFEKAQLIK